MERKGRVRRWTEDEVEAVMNAHRALERADGE